MAVGLETTFRARPSSRRTGDREDGTLAARPGAAGIPWSISSASPRSRPGPTRATSTSDSI